MPDNSKKLKEEKTAKGDREAETCETCSDQEAKAERKERRRSSMKERKEDALAPVAEEGRGKLRKAAGSRKQIMIRRYPNGGTHME